MSPFSQTFASHAPAHVRSVSVSQWISSHTYLLNVVSIACVILLALTYIVQVNSSASKGYTIRDLETEIKQLTLANQQMELAATQAQSLDHINHAVKMIGLVPAEQPTYVDASAGSVAFAR